MLGGIESHCQSMSNLPKKCMYAIGLASKNSKIQVIRRFFALNLDEHPIYDTAIALSIGWQHTDVATALLEDAYKKPGKLANPTRAPRRAVLMGMSEVVALIISLIVGNDRCYEGMDLLEMASISGRPEIVEILIDRKSELRHMNSKNRYMNRCFYRALEYDNHELLQALIDWGFGDSIIPHEPQQLKGKDE